MKLFEFQCWVFGGKRRNFFSEAGKTIATLALLQELRARGKENSGAVKPLLRACFPDPETDIIRVAVQFSVLSKFREHVEKSRIAANVIDFSWRFYKGKDSGGYKGGAGEAQWREPSYVKPFRTGRSFRKRKRRSTGSNTSTAPFLSI